jgi:hypothetical protein
MLYCWPGRSVTQNEENIALHLGNFVASYEQIVKEKLQYFNCKSSNCIFVTESKFFSLHAGFNYVR